MKNLQNITKYFYPYRILDIGAHFGEFYSICKHYYPESYYFLVEGNKNCENYLKNFYVDYSIELLSNEIKDINFYINKKDLVSTGCSYYKECNTEHFVPENLIIEHRKTNTLDNMFESDSIFDLIKMDTQGSELDIIKGGVNLIKHTKGLLLECSVNNCNEGAPLYSDVKEYLKTINFQEKEILDEHYYKNEIIQIDVLFTKDTI